MHVVEVLLTAATVCSSSPGGTVLVALQLICKCIEVFNKFKVQSLVCVCACARTCVCVCVIVCVCSTKTCPFGYVYIVNLFLNTMNCSIS